MPQKTPFAGAGTWYPLCCCGKSNLYFSIHGSCPCGGVVRSGLAPLALKTAFRLIPSPKSTRPRPDPRRPRLAWIPPCLPPTSLSSSAPVRWTTPASWQELAPTSIRIGNFAVPGKGDAKAEVGVFSFPGSVGTELDNVNRWRKELKLPPVEADQITSEPVTIDSLPGSLYDLPGATSRTVVASLPRNGATWFFKMRGDKDTVADAKPVVSCFFAVHSFQRRRQRSARRPGG